MKKRYYILCLITALASGQNQNYIKNKTYKVETAVSLASPSAVQAVENITYFDGLGRPIQQRAYRQSNSGKDIVTHIEYDALGRQTKEFLPYASQTPSLQYDANSQSEVLSFYGSPTQSRTGSADFEPNTNPWSEKLLEASPLSRVLKQAAPGATWAMGSGHEIRMDYQANMPGDAVRHYTTVAGTPTSGYYPVSLSQQGTYAEGTLYKSVVRDENWTSGNHHTTQEFKNKSGQVVLARSYGTSSVGGVATDGWHDTYYVYDQYGNLSFVLPPLADGSGSTADLDGLCYQYRYDKRNRLVEKKLPGKQWEFIIYDRLDRVVATGPAFSPFSNFTAPNNVGWLVMKYDQYNRIAYTGWMLSSTVTSAGRNTLQEERNQQASNFSESKTGISGSATVNGVNVFYTNMAWPSGSAYHILSASYYDSYSYPYPSNVFEDVEGEAIYYNSTTKPKGLPTESWARVLETSMLTAGTLSSNFYDSKARAIRIRTTNHLGGYTQMDSKINFQGQVLYTKTSHKRTASDTELAVREDFAYSDQGRLVTHTHQINSNAVEMLAKHQYDELGQLIGKGVGNTEASPLQKVNYSYNARGWLKEINKTASLAQSGDPADLFAFRLSYNATEFGAELGLFNGNISETYWRTASDNKLRKYLYEYDSMNRLLSASYQKPGGVPVPNSYGESQAYDKNGNITRLERFGEFDDAVVALLIDELAYAYEPNSNRLAKVTDATSDSHGFGDDSDGTNDTADDYAYDGNGNMVSDQNKRITLITYNHLDLPVKIMFASGNSIEYIYTASGSKIKKTVTEAPKPVKTQEYLNGMVYSNGILEVVPTSEGYVKNTVVSGANVFNYVYNYTDHLGNVRLSYTQDYVTRGVVIMEENNYYPFGLKHKNYNTSQRTYNKSGLGVPSENACGVCPRPYKYNYKYNGKEFQDELGLNLYDYGARNYDPAIGRFMNIDRLAEKFENLTTYQYAGNTPTYFIDVNGEYIYINDPNEEGKQYRYQNGVTQHQVDGEWQTIDSSTQLSDFVLNTVAGLNTLENSGKTGKGLVDNFSSSGNDVTFQYQKDGAGYKSGMISLDNSNSGSTFVKTAGGIEMQKSPYFITIGHEMAHAQDPVKVNFMDTWYRTRSGDEVTKREIYASHYENMIRAESGLPLRTHYGSTYDRVSGSYKPEPRSRLIDRMGNSVYYGHGNARGYPSATINDGLKADGGIILRNRFNYNDKE